jgi:hydrogenase maturation protein HypF
MKRRPAAFDANGTNLQRLRIVATGAVQGVGFRPFVHRLAVSEGLAGFVRNTGEGVALEVEGTAQALERFVARFDREPQAPVEVRGRSIERVVPRGDREFTIAPSTRESRQLAVVLPDLAICAQCLDEIQDPGNRRYRYPFTTCVHCGPRFSIVESTPYDRERTAMRYFTMCAECQAEYDDPASRRFHAETNACPHCGPRLTLLDAAGRESATGDAALREAAEALRTGAIVAMKGLGGFQLLADARNDAAVRLLRERKRRPSKPFAIMVPGYGDVAALADVSVQEKQLLCSAAAPIVLLRAHGRARGIAPAVAPANPWLGVMLPYTPLHHLLMQALGFPIVATSGNCSGEPIVADEREALDRLAGLADFYLVHDRPIVHPIDDSVVRVIAGEPVVIRHARGYAPLMLSVPALRDAAPVVALGGHGKSAIAVTSGPQMVFGPYIGDLDGSIARAAFVRGVHAMQTLFPVSAPAIACDTHPDYYSTQCAEKLPAHVQHVPHHVAHVLAGMVDNDLDGPLLGVAWDGSGYGGDGTVWGGEFLFVNHDRNGCRYRRVAHLLPFRLPGGEAAVRQPGRAALGALHAVYGEALWSKTALPPVGALTSRERQVFAVMLARGVQSPLTSSAGRLFDAAASILGLCRLSTFEGEAALALEAATGGANGSATGAFALAPAVLREANGEVVADWTPMLDGLVHAREADVSVQALAVAFHEALARIIVDTVAQVAARIGICRVLLTGGCFQNAWLATRALALLREAGLKAFCHRRVPPNDGGLAVGQALFAARPLFEEKL